MHARTRLLALGAGAALAMVYVALAQRKRAGQWVMQPSIAELSHPANAPTIVVLGAGFAGVSAARELARRLPRPEDARIVLIDETDFLLFTPMLTEVVGGELDVHDVTTAVLRLSPRVSFFQARVERVDLAEHTVHLLVGSNVPDVTPVQCTMHADHLVLALGSVTNFHHVPGLEDHALTIKSVAEAGAIHDRALALLERAAAETDAATRRALLTFVVGGGGFSGVETMAALNSLVRALAPYYPGIRGDELRTVLVHPHDRLLPELGPRLAEYAQHELEARGVEVVLNTKVEGVGTDYVDLEGQPRLPTHTIIWTGGVTPSPVVRDLPCRHGRHHGVVTDSACRVPDFPGVWAVGDCAETPRPGSDETYTATAQNATREGTRVARNIVASLRGQPVTPFSYRPIGELAVVGDRAAVAEVYGVHLAGLPAWLMWRAVYLAKEPNLGKRVRTALDWMLDLAGPRALPEFPGHAEDVNGREAATPARGGSGPKSVTDSKERAASGAAAS